MKALITGASSGLGRDMARVLADMDVELILVARRGDRLRQIQEEVSVPVQCIALDLSQKENCLALYERMKEEHIDILINNAGFGDFGYFQETSLDKDLAMIDTNVRAVHMLTKLFLKDFVKRDSGYILNVASSAAFLPGPLMASYYASKAYVQRLSLSINKELRKQKANVYVSALCPGPIQTEFAQVANVKFLMDGMASEKAARIAIRGLFKQQDMIIPGKLMKVGYFLTRILPNKVLMEASYHIQHRKNK